jgi:spore maturation protein CgeB
MTGRPRILFVWSAAEFSTFDVARGFRTALERRREYDVYDYRLYARLRYHAAALGDEKAANLNLLTRQASDNVVVEALRHRADLVLIISGMALHPDAIWLLRRAHIRTAVLFTESPYNDEEQRAFHAVYPEMICFTNERTSARDGWIYLPPAYDPAVHRPVSATERPCDVLLIGTFWSERIRLLEQVDWTGLTVRLIGTWVAPPSPEDSPIGRFYEHLCVRNIEAAGYYASAAICLNPHRTHPRAESMNPRAYELAACGAFQLSDPRAELVETYDECVPTFRDAAELESRIREWQSRPADRARLAAMARTMVAPQTFDARLETLLAYVGMASRPLAASA